MSRRAILTISLSFLLAISLLTLASAYDYYPAARDYSWDSGSSYSTYTLQPSFSEFTKSLGSYISTNYDSGSAYSSSTGPYIKMKVKYNEYWHQIGNDWVKDISYTDNSYMVGGSSYSGSEYQNRQSTSWTIDEETDRVYQGGFTWSKADAYDSSEYDSGDLYNYYYHPVYSDGCYVWDY
jgi:hypothetical protein